MRKGVARRRQLLGLAALPALAHVARPPAARADPPAVTEWLPEAALLPGWQTAGRPVVVMLPDHLGADARLAFHAAPLLARGIGVVVPTVPAVSDLGERLRPRPAADPAAAKALLPGLRALLHHLAAEAPGRPLALFGFGTGGDAALLVAATGGVPGLRAVAALYPGCAWPALKAARAAGAPPPDLPHLLVLPHGGAAGDLPDGCADLYPTPPAPARDRVTLRGYDGLGHGFDIWPAQAWQDRDPGFDWRRFDAVRALLARQEVAGFLAGALLPETALPAGVR